MNAHPDLESSQTLLQTSKASTHLASSTTTEQPSISSAPSKTGARFYQLYADEHHDTLTLPDLPHCAHICDIPDDIMQELRSSVCSCGKTMFDSIDRCSVCAQSRQKRMSQHGYVLPERPAKRLTPPPSQPFSPRRSYEALSPPAPTRNPSAGEVFTSALSAENGSSSSSSLFPPSMHRHHTRPNADSRRTSEASSVRSIGSSTPTMSEGQDTSRKLSRPATPDARILDSGYAPMAAGFARLNRKSNTESGGSSYDQPWRGRASSARPSLDLGARMFSGPA